MGRWQGLPYIEMEKVTGITLEDLVEERGSLPAEVCVAIGILACRALEFAHGQKCQLYGIQYYGVVHRDLKPSNIMLCESGNLKVMDSGIARPVDASLHTMEGGVVGTLQYLSPEQLDGKDLDVRTDIYSLGATLYEALSGRKAFPEKKVAVLLAEKMRNRYRPLTDFGVRAPRRLVRLIHRCMARDRERRVPGARAMLAELKPIAHGLGMGAPEEVPAKFLAAGKRERVLLGSRRRVPLRIALWLATAVAAAVAGYFVALRFIATQTAVGPEAAPPVTVVEAVAEKPPSTTTPARSTTKTDAVAAARGPAPAGPRSSSQPTVTVVPGPSTPEPAPPRALPTRELTPVEKLQVELGTADPAQAIALLNARGRHAEALAVYSSLEPAQAEGARTAVLALRSQAQSGGAQALDRFLAAHDVNDGEFYGKTVSREYAHAGPRAVTLELGQCAAAGSLWGYTTRGASAHRRFRSGSPTVAARRL